MQLIPRAPMTTPSDTQFLILSRAATRPGNLAMPLPDGLAGAAAKMVVGKMIARGWLEEVAANLRRGEPMWRETGDGHGTTLIATEAGLEAIGIEPVVASAVASERKAKPKPEPTQSPDAANTAIPVASALRGLPSPRWSRRLAGRLTRSGVRSLARSRRSWVFKLPPRRSRAGVLCIGSREREAHIPRHCDVHLQREMPAHFGLAFSFAFPEVA
jgi:hypothetical protein